MLSLMHNEFASADVLSTARRLGFATTDVNVRSQLSIYAGKGIIERVGNGRYRIAPAIEHKLMESETPPAETGGVPGNTGEAATSPNPNRSVA